MSTKRIAQLKTMLAGRTDRDGNALKGYAKNVVAIRAELARLESAVALQTATVREAQESAPGLAPAAPATDPEKSPDDAALVAANG